MKPFPLQFRTYLDPGWRAADAIQDPRAEFQAAAQKLR